MARVIKKSAELQGYSKKVGERLQYFNVVAASGTDAYKLKVYQIHRYTMVRIGMSYKFSSCIEKPDSLWVVSGSSIGYVKDIAVDSSLRIPLLPEEEPSTGSKRTLAQALTSPSKSTIQAKIVKVSPVNFRKDGTLPVRCLGLKDDSGYAKVALFADIAEKSYAPNTTVEITGVYMKTHEKKTQLAVTRETTCQYLPENEVHTTIDEVDEAYFMRDPDFQIRDGDTMATFEVESINDVMSYDGCTTLGCRLKKLKDGHCPNCEGTESKPTNFVKMTITGENCFTKDVTLFERDLERLFGKFPNPLAAEDELINFMLEQFPVHFTAKYSGTNFYNITLKQRNECSKSNK